MRPLMGAATFTLHGLLNLAMIFHHTLLDLKSSSSSLKLSGSCIPWKQCKWCGELGCMKVPGPLDTSCAIESLEDNAILCSFLVYDIKPQGYGRLLSRLKASGEEQMYSAAFGNSLACRSRETSLFINLIVPIKSLPVLQLLVDSL